MIGDDDADDRDEPEQLSVVSETESISSDWGEENDDGSHESESLVLLATVA